MKKPKVLWLTIVTSLVLGACGEENTVGPDTPDPPDPPDPPAPTIPRYDFRPTMASGPGFGCQIRESSGSCWGVNTFGEFGNGSQSTEWSYPTDPGWDPDFVLLTAGNDFMCGMTEAGEGYCWGYSRYGLGTGAGIGEVVTRPTEIPASEPWSYIEALGNGACGVSESGRGFCWGSNASGQIGDSTTVNRTVPSPVGGDHSWYMISPGSAHTCGVDIEGGLWCWGSNSGGQLGLGAGGENMLWPMAVDTTRRWASVSAGQGRTCAITEDFEGWCWGLGGLGDGSSGGSATPVPVSGGHRWAHIRSTWSTCGITTTEEAFCWGRAGNGEIGAGPVYGPSDEQPVPRRVDGDRSWLSLSSPTLVSFCGETTGSEVLCWGRLGPMVCSAPAWSPEPVLGSAEERGACELRFVSLPPLRFRPAVVDSAYETSVTAMGGGGGPYTWEIASGVLPDGMALTSDGSEGRIQGVPTQTGRFELRIRVSGGGQSAEADAEVRVNACQDLGRPRPEPPTGRVGSAYTYRFEGTGADGIYSWRLDRGRLPPGLSLDEDGLLAGTPTEAGTYALELIVAAPNCGSVQTGIDVELVVES